MNVSDAGLPGVRLIEPRVFSDARGSFFESWNRARYAAAGVATEFAQDNLSISRRGVLRGLHFQHPRGQGKLVSVLQGEVWDVVVDVRAGAPTFGRWVAHVLSAANRLQLWIPEGFAHGFIVRSDEALFLYKCTDFYDPACEATILWNDPDLAIPWPVADPILSDKDHAGTLLRDFSPDRLPMV